MALLLPKKEICLIILMLCSVAAHAMTRDETQALFDEAMQLRDSGYVYDAIEIFEKILKDQPRLNRVRLELAVAYHRAGRYDDAQALFNAVLNQQDTPENVRLAILAYQGQINSDKSAPDARNDFSYYVKAGVIYNSNINSSPGQRQYSFGGTGGPGGTGGMGSGMGGGANNVTTDNEESSFGSDIALSASNRYSRKQPINILGTITHFEWENQASLSSYLYTNTNDYDLNTITLLTGPSLVAPGHWRSLISLRIDRSYLGGEPLSTITSINPVINFELGKFRGLKLEASLLSHSYDQAIDAGRDASETMFGAGYNAVSSDFEVGAEIGVRLNTYDADLAEYSYDATELYLAAYTALSPQSNIYLNINNKHYSYEAADSISGLVRDESENRLAAGMNYDFSDTSKPGWTMNLELAVTNNDSNVDTYDFDRTIITLNWSKYIQ